MANLRGSDIAIAADMIDQYIHWLFPHYKHYNDFKKMGANFGALFLLILMGAASLAALYGLYYGARHGCGCLSGLFAPRVRGDVHEQGVRFERVPLVANQPQADYGSEQLQQDGTARVAGLEAEARSGAASGAGGAVDDKKASGQVDVESQYQKIVEQLAAEFDKTPVTPAAICKLYLQNQQYLRVSTHVREPSARESGGINYRIRAIDLRAILIMQRIDYRRCMGNKIILSTDNMSRLCALNLIPPAYLLERCTINADGCLQIEWRSLREVIVREWEHLFLVQFSGGLPARTYAADSITVGTTNPARQLAAAPPM